MDSVTNLLKIIVINFENIKRILLCHIVNAFHGNDLKSAACERNVNKTCG